MQKMERAEEQSQKPRNMQLRKFLPSLHFSDATVRKHPTSKLMPLEVNGGKDAPDYPSLTPQNRELENQEINHTLPKKRRGFLCLLWEEDGEVKELEGH